MSEASSRLKPIGVAGRILGTFFFMAFFGMGLLFCGLILRDVYQTALTYGWKKTDCVILNSAVREDSRHQDAPYTFAIQFEYSWQGQIHTSDKFALKPRSFTSYSDAQRLVEKYTADTKGQCYLNSADPGVAILRRGSLWVALMILLPLLFVAIGVGGIYAMWRQPNKSRDGLAPLSPVTAVDTKTVPGKRLPVLFFLFFLIIGGAIFCFTTVRPVFLILAARHWQETPCVILSSRLQSHSDTDGRTYRVDILYAYEFNGREYKSNRYHFMGGSSSGHSGKANIVRQHPPGQKTVCYMNPTDASEAVLERGFTRDMWWGAVPLLFVLIGAGGIASVLFRGRPGK